MIQIYNFLKNHLKSKFLVLQIKTAVEEYNKILEKLRNDGHSIRFVKNPDILMCLTAVKCYSSALMFIENQTFEICLAAVQKDSWTLQYVKNKTPEICLAACNIIKN